MTTTSGGRPPEDSVRRTAAPASPPRPSAPAAPGTVVPSGGAPFVPRQRKMRLTVQRVDPWTVLRLAFLLSVACAVITLVALLLLWSMLETGGVFGSVDNTLQSIMGDGAITVTQYFSLGKVLSVAMLIGAIDIVLITALATIGAFLFNLAASLVGGLQLTVTEDI